VSGPLEGSKTISKEKGKIKLDCLSNSTDSNPVIFGDVLLVPTLKKNLISVQKLCEAGAQVEFSKEKSIVKFQNKILFVAILDDSKLFKIQIKEKKEIAETNQVSIQTWHERLGHVSEKTLKMMSEKNIIADDVRDSEIYKYRVVARSRFTAHQQEF